VPEQYFPNPVDEIRREGGLDPEFRYPGRRFATAAAFRKNIPHFINEVGLVHIAVLLLTFRRPVTVKRARRFLNNIWRRFFKGIFGHYALVVEFTKTGRIHFHIVAQVFDDLRTGFNFQHYRDYKIANERAAAEGKPFTCKLRRLLRDPCRPTTPSGRSGSS
jgi:hypothetical protein